MDVYRGRIMPATARRLCVRILNLKQNNITVSGKCPSVASMCLH
jgi:hypothetical protein